MEMCTRPVFSGVVFKPEFLPDWQQLDTLMGPVDLLASFYRDPIQFGYPLQQKIMLSLAKRETECPSDVKVSMVMERSLDTAVNVFSEVMWGEGWLTNTEIAVIRETGPFLRQITPLVPTGVVYLDVEVDEAFRRIRRRGRGGEHLITRDYLAKIKKEEENWFKTNADKIPHLIWLDANEPAEEVFKELLTYEHQINCALRDPDAF
jgi:deoxyadenosine/deoxycytidine kinase